MALKDRCKGTTLKENSREGAFRLGERTGQRPGCDEDSVQHDTHNYMRSVFVSFFFPFFFTESYMKYPASSLSRGQKYLRCKTKTLPLVPLAGTHITLPP